MKTIKIILIALFFSFVGNIEAQVSVNVNIGSPPAWAPVGYTEAEYYYMPDIESYYDVRQSQFIYFENSRWIRAQHLPPAYRSYDLYHGHTVVLTDYHGHTPYSHFKNHKVKYYKGYTGKAYKSNGNRHNKGKGHGKGHGKH